MTYAEGIDPKCWRDSDYGGDGMGCDGARGLKEMLDAGARTLGQDENSCVVYGVLKEAFKLGTVERELPLSKIPQEIVNYGKS